MADRLVGRKIAILAADGFEQVALTEPFAAILPPTRAATAAIIGSGTRPTLRR